MIEIQLAGSFTAICGDYSVTHKKNDPVPILLRKMIADCSVGEDDLVTIKRGDVTCFNSAPVKSWSDFTIRCNDNGGISKYKYEPFEKDFA